MKIKKDISIIVLNNYKQRKIIENKIIFKKILQKY